MQVCSTVRRSVLSSNDWCLFVDVCVFVCVCCIGDIDRSAQLLGNENASVSIMRQTNVVHFFKACMPGEGGREGRWVGVSAYDGCSVFSGKC